MLLLERGEAGVEHRAALLVGLLVVAVGDGCGDELAAFDGGDGVVENFAACAS